MTTPRLKLRARKRRRLPPLSQAGSLALSTGIFVTLLGLYNRSAAMAEARPGARLEDPLLPLLPKADLAFLVFALVYGGLILAIWEHGRSAERAARVLRACAILIALRIAALYLAPLAPPEGALILRDPVVESFGSARVFTHALFFSGHTAALALLSGLSQERSHRAALALSAAAIGVALLAQRAHYSVDVLAAPFFALGALTLERRLSRRP